MSGRGYASRAEALDAAKEAMRQTFGPEVRFEPIPPITAAPRNFRVLDGKGHHLESFGLFLVGPGKREWAWQEATPRS